jgi:Ca-activated chloride channel family protein
MRRTPRPISAAPAPAAGLLSAGGAPVALTAVQVDAELRDLAVRQTITQRYRNAEDQPIEAVYVFPIDEGAAVCGFNAVVDGTLVVGEVMEREAAFAMYDDAIGQGHGAYLLDQERADVFTASIGNLPPGAEVVIQVITASLLGIEGEDLVYILPTTVSPRYAPPEDRVGLGRPPSEALNPPLAWEVPYGLQVTLDAVMPSAIRRIESPTHPLTTELDGDRARITLAQQDVALDRDLVIRIGLESPLAPRLHLERHPSGRYAAMLVFRPQSSSAPASSPAPREVVFLVDRSGSMGGPSIEGARSALQLFLRALPESLPFNIIGFGNTFQSLYEYSQPLDEASLARASEYVDRIEADMGGTDLLPALEHALSRTQAESAVRQVIVLTDGEVTNTDAVIGAAREHASHARVFTIGLGAGASRHLVQGLARAGRGRAEFIAPGERAEPKIMRQVARALSPTVTDLALEWGLLDVEQAPFLVPPAFDGEPLVIFGLLPALKETVVKLRVAGAGQDTLQELSLDPARASDGILLTTLAARALVRDLEEETSALHTARGSRQTSRRTPVDEEARKRLISLGTQYSLLTSATSFVAIEERPTPVSGQVQLRRIPVALSSGWGGLRFEKSFTARSAAPAASAHGLVGRMDFELVSPRSLFSTPADSPRISAPPPRADVPLDPYERLVRLLALQRSDGSWHMTSRLWRLVAGPSPKPDRASDVIRRLGIPADDKLAQRTFATWLVLTWLEHSMLPQRDTWRLAADKGARWLDQHGAPPPGTDSWQALAAIALGIS